MERVTWNQTLSNYHNMNFQPNNRVQKLSIKQNLSGKGIRVELSNQFDAIPLKVKMIHFSLSADFKTFYSLTFNKQKSFISRANHKIWTDKLAIDIPLKAELFFRIEVENELNLLATSANLQSNKIIDSNIQNEYTFIYAFTSVIIDTSHKTKTIGFFGDSLTNQAHFSDQILQNLYATADYISGFNAGISGNRLLLPGTANSEWRDSFGESGINRFRSHVLNYRPNIIVSLIGINDLFHPGTGCLLSELPTAKEMIAGYRALYNEAAANNACLIVLTLPPFANSSNQNKPAWSQEKENIRLAVNDWIRSQPYSIDIANFLADRNDPTLLDPQFDCGDHLHFSQQGGEKLGNYITSELQIKGELAYE